MHPAFSVILLTILIGSGQGLLLALVTAQSYAALGVLPARDAAFYVDGSLIVLGLLAAGLAASFFHLGRPERAWRAASSWRTSWLSREVIALPANMALVGLYLWAHHANWSLGFLGIETGVAGDLTLIVGAAAALASLVLFLCTGMIYASIRFLAEWATPLTVTNYTLLGIASGFTLATAWSGAGAALDLANFFGFFAVVATLAACATRCAALYRNARLRPRSSPATAIGVRHRRIRQVAQGATGATFNNREFFHGASDRLLRLVRVFFLVAVFPVPVALLAAGMLLSRAEPPVAALVIQHLGLLAERWYFFADANHPQNIYYQRVS